MDTIKISESSGFDDAWVQAGPEECPACTSRLIRESTVTWRCPDCLITWSKVDIYPGGIYWDAWPVNVLELDRSTEAAIVG